MAKIVHIYNEVTSFLSEENKMEFLLYHFAINEKYGQDYIEFFNKLDKYKIFDNSFYELRKTIDYDDYFNYAEQLKVSEIILPDKLWDGKWTREQVSKALNEYYDYIRSKGWKIAAVIQGENVSDVIKGFETYLQDDRIDVIMIPRKVLHRSKWLELGATSYSDARLKLWEILKEKFIEQPENVFTKEIHFLGANSLYEILKVRHDNYIRSIDTKWFSKMLLGDKWEHWDEQQTNQYESLKQKWQIIKQTLDYDEKYGVV